MRSKGAARDGWTRVRFGDIAEQINDRVDDPNAAGVDRYVGLEHLDPGSLRVTRWGSPDDVSAQKLRFHSGDIIFGKRRAYQRKVAVADFEGICSAHAMVLRERPEALAPGFLIHFMASDVFMERAVQISVGSLSPTINWSTLRDQEFFLPPIEQQRKIADVSIAHRALSDKQRDASSAAGRLFQSHLTAVFAGLAVDPTVSSRPLGEIARVERGQFTHRPRNLPQFFGGPYPFVQTGDVAASQGYLQRASQALSDEGKAYSRSFPRDTILITIAAVIGATAITTGETWCPDSVVGIQPDARVVRVRYLEFALRYARPYLDGKVATQTAQKNINLAVLRPLPIPVPSIEKQQQIETALAHVELAAQAVRHRAVATDALMRLFTGA